MKAILIRPVMTSFFTNKAISNDDAIPVRISRGAPRFRLPYKVEASLLEFAPTSAIRKLAGEEYFDAYLEQIRSVGIERAVDLLNNLAAQEDQRTTVLLCFCKPG